MITPNKIAFFCLRLFFGIGTFQWVTADSNKIFLPLRLASPKFVFSQVPRRRASEARVRSGHRESCTRTSVFRKGNVAESGFSFSRSAGRGGRRHSPQPSPRKRGEGVRGRFTPSATRSGDSVAPAPWRRRAYRREDHPEGL